LSRLSRRDLVVGASYTYQAITGLPPPHPFSRGVNVVAERRPRIYPQVSVIVPVFNKVRIVADILKRICENMSCDFELIVIDDASQDNSLEAILSCINVLPCPYLVLANSTPIYETACDNVGFSLSLGKFFLEIQSDIQVLDHGFDKKMVRVASLNHVSSVSGRCVHSWIFLLPPKARVLKLLYSPWFYFRSRWKLLGVGLMGKEMHQRNKRSIKEGYFLADTNNKGPWMITAENFKTYGPLDSNNFFLGGDDHNFNYQLKKKGKLAAYVTMNVFSSENDGSTRQARAGENLRIYNYLLENKKGFRRLVVKLMVRRFSIPQFIEYGDL
jgi:glycosyltransferase involved in cell wall biosynthesis